MIYWIAFGLAALAALLATPVAAHLGRRFDLVDRPGVRKVHSRSTPHTGGFAIVLAFIVAAFGAVLASRMLGINVSWERQGLVMVAAGLLVFAMGVLDDAFPMRGLYKLFVLGIAAAAVCGSGTIVDPAEFSKLGPAAWLAAWGVTMVWIVAVTVAVNFMDGLDGLAGGIVVVAAATLLLWVGIVPESTGTMIYAAAIMGAAVGFLGWNRYPAKIFMGDGGSMFLGFTLASCCVLATKQVGHTRGLLVPALALGVPLVDLAVTMIRRRFVMRRSIFAAERGHIHHRLIDMGLWHPHAVIVLWAVTVTAGFVGAFAVSLEGSARWGVMALVVPLLYVLFRTTGSARARVLLDAVRTTRGRDRRAKDARDHFDQLQLEFAKVRGFGMWWETVCLAADRLGCASLALPVISREGQQRVMNWRHSEEAEEVHRNGHEARPLELKVPLASRRLSDDLNMTVSMRGTQSLEDAMDRARWFARIIDDHGLTGLVEPAGIAQEADGSGERPGDDSAESGSTHSATSAVAEAADPPVRPVLPQLRVAVVHDFLYTYGGAERVLEQILHVVPQADVFALFDFLPEEKRGFLQGKEVKTTFLQKMPLAKKKHRAYLPLMPLAIEQLDVSGYDLVISSSYMAAKGVITGPAQKHVCYCHSPVRYAWDLQHQYLDEAHLGFGPRGLLARLILHYIRNWDARSANGVDTFLANSHFVAKRIEKLYRRDAHVVHPPVATHRFPVQHEKEDFYVTASRLVPYKRTDLIVEAFNRRPDLRLIVIGEGPQREHLEKIAGPNVTIAGALPHARMARYFAMAKAFVFAAEEDFGIVPVEAMASGTPIIAYGGGGALETVISGRTGVHFGSQTPEALLEALAAFEAKTDWDPDAIRAHAEGFGHQVFTDRLGEHLENSWADSAISTHGAVMDSTESAADSFEAFRHSSHPGEPNRP